MRIVITGASGNVGTALLLRLGATGEHELVGVSRRWPPDAAPYSWAEWVTADVGAHKAEDVLEAAFTGADAVVQLIVCDVPGRASLRAAPVRSSHSPGRGRPAPCGRLAGTDLPPELEWPCDSLVRELDANS